MKQGEIFTKKIGKITPQQLVDLKVGLNEILTY